MGPGRQDELDARIVFSGPSSPRFQGSPVTVASLEGVGEAHGRVVAFVPGCAFVIVGTSREQQGCALLRGADHHFAIAHSRSVYHFTARVNDVLEQHEGGFTTWAVRAAFPKMVRVVQRRAEPRASLEQAGVPVYLKKAAVDSPSVPGRGVNLSAAGLLAEFEGSTIIRSAGLSAGAEARVIFGVPGNGKLKPEDVDALMSVARLLPGATECPVVQTPQGGVILDVPTHIARYSMESLDVSTVAFHFERLPEEGLASIRKFVDRRLAETV